MAKLENRVVKDGDIKMACQQSCPSNAIVFGDLNDPNSEISKLYKNERSYTMLEEYNVQASVKYLTKIRNVEDAIAGEHKVKGHDGGHEEHKEKAHEAAEHHS
jgi:molybdopterin-containing oxidoreductase family iron-sulfur binding subunit